MTRGPPPPEVGRRRPARAALASGRKLTGHGLHPRVWKQAVAYAMPLLNQRQKTDATR